MNDWRWWDLNLEMEVGQEHFQEGGYETTVGKQSKTLRCGSVTNKTR